VDIVFAIMIAIAGGGIAGSVVNMLATRLPADDDPPILGAPLRPRTGMADRFALAPYIGARTAGGAVDWHKLATDVAAAALVALALLRHGLSFDGVRAAVFALVLLLVLRIDWQHHLIFSIVIGPAIALALAIQALDSTDALVSAAIALVIAALVFFVLYAAALLIYGKRALGFGDVLLAALIGAMTELRGVPTALFAGMFLAAAGGLLLIALRVRSKSDFIPYGAYLCLGAMVVVLFRAY
jgi:leader peptidase (prepilin peptidase)/N-methyltransferase